MVSSHIGDPWMKCCTLRQTGGLSKMHWELVVCLRHPVKMGHLPRGTEILIQFCKTLNAHARPTVPPTSAANLPLRGGLLCLPVSSLYPGTCTLALWLKLQNISFPISSVREMLPTWWG